MALWIWSLVGLMVGGYVYAALTASYLDNQTRQKLRELRRDGAVLDRMQTGAFTAPTSDVARQLQARLQALEFSATVQSDAEVAAADAAADAAAAVDEDEDEDEDGNTEAAAAAESTPSDGAVTSPSPLFEVEAERPMVPSRSSLRPYDRQLDALARDVGASYDGWRLPDWY